MLLAGKKNTRTLVVIMAATVILGFMIARYYYRSFDRSVDPRIAEARELYSDYNRLAMEGDYLQIFRLLDSIEKIYLATEHYRNSFEVGVLHNNRAAAMLTIALHRESIPPAADPFPDVEFDSLVLMAETHIREAMGIYRQWQKDFKDQTEEEIGSMITPVFMIGLEDLPAEKRGKHLERRVREIMDALVENDRRLSVCYSNLGLVCRHQGNIREAAENYGQALELWERNLEAENNLNLLLGRPLKKRNLLQRLFPPERETAGE